MQQAGTGMCAACVPRVRGFQHCTAAHILGCLCFLLLRWLLRMFLLHYGRLTWLLHQSRVLCLAGHLLFVLLLLLLLSTRLARS